MMIDWDMKGRFARDVYSILGGFVFPHDGLVMFFYIFGYGTVRYAWMTTELV